MNFLSDQEKRVIAEFEKNNGKLTIKYRASGEMREYDKDFSDAFIKLLRDGKIKRLASGDFGWVMYGLKKHHNQNKAGS